MIPSLLVTAALAQSAPIRHTFGDSGWSVDTRGHLRELVMVPIDMDVTADGANSGQRVVLDQRLRANLGFEWRPNGDVLRIATEWDLFTGQIAGDTVTLRGAEVDARRRDALLGFTGKGFLPRRASIGFTSDEGLAFEAGIIPANWGLGVLANGGDKESLFGRTDRGDRMVRIRTTFAPFRKQKKIVPVYATFGFDQVIEDDLARWGEQSAQQFITSVLYADQQQRKLGFFLTYRDQREPGPARQQTSAVVLDVYGDLPIALGDKGWKLRLATEAAGILGTTQKVIAYADPDATTQVQSAAVAVETSVTSPGDWVTVHLHGGAASATGDPDGGVLRDFTFDSNYNVGLVLFDEVMGTIENGTYSLVSDPANAGAPPLGADLLVSEGAVRRATYLQPAAVVRPTGWLDLRLGGVFAWSTGPIAQSFYTARAGGDPRNYLNQPTEGHWLGAEVDWAVGFGRGATTAAWKARPRLVVEGGHAFLGKNLGAPGHVFTVLATGQLDW